MSSKKPKKKRRRKPRCLHPPDYVVEYMEWRDGLPFRVRKCLSCGKTLLDEQII